jgi:hypothetical protein
MLVLFAGALSAQEAGSAIITGLVASERLIAEATVIAETVRELHGILTSYDLPHEFEIYDGDHLSGIAERIRTKLLPLMSRTLSFESPPSL